MKRDFKEEDMYDLVCDYFLELGYKVNGEVRSCDVTAIKDDTLVILELKKSLSMELLIQAVKRQKLGDLTYICVPKPKNYTKNKKHQDLLYFLKRLSLGLIYCEPDKNILEVLLHPVEFDMAKSKKLNKRQRDQLIKEIDSRKTSLNKGGSRGKKLMTAYREEALKLAWHCSGQTFLTPKEGIEKGVPKAPAILRANYYGWFLKVGRGKYELSPAGAAAIIEHQAALLDIMDESDPAGHAKAMGSLPAGSVQPGAALPGDIDQD